jgi:hypothetical protein
MRSSNLGHSRQAGTFPHPDHNAEVDVDEVAEVSEEDESEEDIEDDQPPRIRRRLDLGVVVYISLFAHRSF